MTSDINREDENTQSLESKPELEIRKVCLLNGNQPIKLNSHQLSALAA